MNMKFDAKKRQIVIDLRKAGMAYLEIANQIGNCSTTWVRNVCVENGLDGTYTKDVRYAEYRKYKAEGHTTKEVAEHFGISLSNAQTACKGIAKQPSYKKTEGEKRDYVERLLPFGFSYDSGYIDCDHHVNIRCNICNDVFDASMITIRQGKRVRCRNCERLAKEADREAKRKRLDEERQQKQSAKELELFLSTYQVECEVCGKIFVTRRKHQICCSPECSRKRSNSLSSTRKDKRIAENKRIDKGITARRLYNRDGGTCWICGGLCSA